MGLRDRAILIVLIIAAAATIATSAPEEDATSEPEDADELHDLTATTSGQVTAPGSRHVSVLLDREAVEEADQLLVEFAWPEQAIYDVMTVIPDDPDLEKVRIVRNPVAVDATSGCPEPGACTVGFTIDAPFEGVGTVITTAVLLRLGRDFSEDAEVRVVFDDE